MTDRPSASYLDDWRNLVHHLRLVQAKRNIVKARRRQIIADSYWFMGGAAFD